MDPVNKSLQDLKLAGDDGGAEESKSNSNTNSRRSSTDRPLPIPPTRSTETAQKASGDVERDIRNAAVWTWPDNDSWQDVLKVHRKTGSKFVDQSFVPGDEILYKNIGDKSKHRDWSNISWHRISEIYGSKAVLFERGSDGVSFLEPGDVRQGMLGDCYFLGALSVVASNQTRLFDVFPNIPDSLQTQVGSNNPPGEQTYNEEGVYAVRFWREGRWVIVVVDDYLPCVLVSSRRKLLGGSIDTYAPAFARPKEGSCEIWAAIAEKAYAKLNGSYEVIEGGHECHALQDLLGGVPFTLKISGPATDAQFSGPGNDQKLWEYLADAVNQNGAFMGCSTSAEGAAMAKSMGMNPATNLTGNITSGGIIEGHAYGILKMVEVTNTSGNRHRLLQLRNPWGKFEWGGAWSDTSNTWSTLSKEERKRVGYSVEDDGTFFMEYATWRKIFLTVSMCMIPPAGSWKRYTHTCTWKGDDGAGASFLHMCPQFELLVPPTPRDPSSTAPVRVVACLTQCDRRYTKSEAYTNAIGMAIATMSLASKTAVRPAVNRLLILPPRIDDNLWVLSRTKSMELQLPPGLHMIVPCPSEQFTVSTENSQILPKGSQASSEDMEDIQCKFTLEVYVYERFGGWLKNLSNACVPCVACGEGLGREDFYADHELHYKCFRCEDCHEAFTPGERYQAMRGSICEEAPLGKALHPNCLRARVKSGAGGLGDVEEGERDVVMPALQPKKAPELGCCHCGEAMKAVPGKFSGKYYGVKEHGTDRRVHGECFEAYTAARAEKCAHCKGPVMKLEGKFSGVFFQVEDVGKIHQECHDAYKQSKAAKCSHCGEPVTSIPGKFCGASYNVKDVGPVHKECYQDFRESRADKCSHCGGPVLAIEGKFSGKFFDAAVTLAGKVHSECWTDFKANRAAAAAAAKTES